MLAGMNCHLRLLCRDHWTARCLLLLHDKGQKDETMMQIVDETKRVEKERNELRNRSRDLEEEVANLRGQVSSLESRLVLLDEENEKNEREMKSTRVSASAHEANARSLKARLESVQEERDKLWREIEILRDTIRT